MTSGGRHRKINPISCGCGCGCGASSLAGVAFAYARHLRGPTPVRHVPRVRAIHGSFAVGGGGARGSRTRVCSGTNRQASGQAVWGSVVDRLEGRSDA